MPRKRIADKEPAVSAEGAAAVPAKAPSKAKATAVKQARAPRASANAVTHRHKKLTVEAPMAAPAVPAETAAPSVAAVEPVAAAPSPEDIARLAYALWEDRGYQGGSPEDDWFTAERLLWSRRNAG